MKPHIGHWHGYWAVWLRRDRPVFPPAAIADNFIQAQRAARWARDMSLQSNIHRRA